MPLQIHTTLLPQGPATAIELTDEQVELLGGGKRAAVLVTVGDHSARLRLAVMGGQNLIGISKANRSTLGVEIGDTIDATIELDAAPREVEIPEDLADALAAAAGARNAFDALPYSQRKEHVRAILEAKRPETRERRITAVVTGVTSAPG